MIENIESQTPNILEPTSCLGFLILGVVDIGLMIQIKQHQDKIDRILKITKDSR